MGRKWRCSSSAVTARDVRLSLRLSTEGSRVAYSLFLSINTGIIERAWTCGPSICSSCRRPSRCRAQRRTPPRMQAPALNRVNARSASVNSTRSAWYSVVTLKLSRRRAAAMSAVSVSGGGNRPTWAQVLFPTIRATRPSASTTADAASTTNGRTTSEARLLHLRFACPLPAGLPAVSRSVSRFLTPSRFAFCQPLSDPM